MPSGPLPSLHRMATATALPRTVHRRPRRAPRPRGRLLALALVPGAAGAAGAVPAVHAIDAQQRLADLGLLPRAAVTGGWNPATVDAVRRFQAARGLDADGVAGTETADRLLAA